MNILGDKYVGYKAKAISHKIDCLFEVFIAVVFSLS
jgi:hypothetical protein